MHKKISGRKEGRMLEKKKVAYSLFLLKFLYGCNVSSAMMKRSELSEGRRTIPLSDSVANSLSLPTKWGWLREDKIGFGKTDHERFFFLPPSEIYVQTKILLGCFCPFLSPSPPEDFFFQDAAARSVTPS